LVIYNPLCCLFLVLHHGFKIQDTIDVLNKGSSEVRYVADLNRQHGTASIKRHGVDIIRTPTSTRTDNLINFFIFLYSIFKIMF